MLKLWHQLQNPVNQTHNQLMEEDFLNQCFPNDMHEKHPNSLEIRAFGFRLSSYSCKTRFELGVQVGVSEKTVRDFDRYNQT